jgi:hypothetical protein
MVCTTGDKYIERHEIVGGARYVQQVNVSAVFSGREYIYNPLLTLPNVSGSSRRPQSLRLRVQKIRGSKEYIDKEGAYVQVAALDVENHKWIP